IPPSATAIATATSAPPTQPAATQPPATQAPVPTATPTTPPVSGNPASASVGVSETGGFYWSPSSVAIAPGGSVTFSWSGGAAHNLTVPALGFSGPIGTSDSETVAFPSPGTYKFSCVVHPTTMNGTVTVQ
ncbi:MAG: plastocyanin/azurin family copper-binding protein, partial [Tepidiformaceae bacterium]